MGVNWLCEVCVIVLLGDEEGERYESLKFGIEYVGPLSYISAA